MWCGKAWNIFRKVFSRNCLFPWGILCYDSKRKVKKKSKRSYIYNTDPTARIDEYSIIIIVP